MMSVGGPVPCCGRFRRAVCRRCFFVGFAGRPVPLLFLGWGAPCAPRSCARRFGRPPVGGAVAGAGRVPCVGCCVFVVVRCYERPVDALASGADEGRGGLRYASGSRLAGCDPRVSEWGDPAPVMGRHPCPKFIGRGG